MTTDEYLISKEDFSRLLEILSETDSDEMDEVEEIKFRVEENVMLDHIITKVTQNAITAKLTDAEVTFLKSRNMTLLQQQKISQPSGNNQPRLPLRKSNISNLEGGLSPLKRYAVLFVEQPIQIDIQKKHEAIIKRYEELEKDPNYITLEDTFAQLNPAEIIAILEWKIDDFAVNHNIEIEFTYSGMTDIEKIKERLKHLGMLFAKKQPDITNFFYIMIRNEVILYLMKTFPETVEKLKMEYNFRGKNPIHK